MIQQAHKKRGRPRTMDVDPFGTAAKRIREVATEALEFGSDRMSQEETDRLTKVLELVS